MELLYVWIENFRNIESKGFNFSNQYEINYDKSSNDIKIQLINGDNALISEDGNLKFRDSGIHYLKDFFDPKIHNVSAIIGKNSSGKSNVIDFILTAISKNNRNRLNTNYVLIFKKDNQPLFWGKTDNQDLRNSSIKSSELPLEKMDPYRSWYTIFYSNVADNKDYIFEGSSVFNFSYAATNNLQSNKIKFVASALFTETWARVNPENHVDKKIRFIFNPIAFNQLENSQLENTKINGVLKRYRKAIYVESTSNYNRFKYSLTVNLFSFLIINGIEMSSLLDNVQIVGQDGVAETIASLNPKIVTFLSEFNEYSQLDGLTESEYNMYKGLILDLQETRYDLGNIERYSNSILVDFNDDFKGIIAGKHDVFNSRTLISHDWSRLSSGMRAYLNLFSQLYYVSEQIHDSTKSVLLCIDEGDLYLHPEWQKNFLNDLIWFIPEAFGDKKIQLILTSHSPFLISDLPKESVLLINEDSNPTRQLNEESSFGANIHQLFAKQFFLKGGSIGQFAKTKITTLLQDIKTIGDDDIEIYQKKIEMIGEPVLRFRLEDELKIRLKELSSETQIRWYEQQIQKLRTQ